ncbi:MAG TPA: Rieske (2Fe-2S) protein, partial [Ramlibacter sp.]|nr:Rieske (2Fe-2S) protein [Ramlibacter sp.]
MNTPSPMRWPKPGLTRVPYDVYTEPRLPPKEQERIFRGDTWNYLCLEAELAEPGSYRTTFVGQAPVVVVRDDDG